MHDNTDDGAEGQPNIFFSIISRDVAGDAVQTVSARELHEWLMVGRDFSSWIRERIAQYGFGENRDFVVFTDSGENLSGGRPSKEYALTLDMAKELAMLERSPQGKAARRYFIECERQAKAANDPAAALSNPAALRVLLLHNVERVIELEGAIQEMRPQVQALERLALSDGSMCITDAAKTLQIQPRTLFDHMKAHHWIYTRQGDNTYIAYQAKLQLSLLEHKTTIVIRGDGSEKTTTQVRVTPKGLARLAKELGNPDGSEPD